MPDGSRPLDIDSTVLLGRTRDGRRPRYVLVRLSTASVESQGTVVAAIPAAQDQARQVLGDQHLDFKLMSTLEAARSRLPFEAEVDLQPPSA